MEMHIYASPDEVITALADFFVATTNEAIAKKGSCTVVLSGGNSPKKLHQLLASEQYRDKVDWSKVSFFFGDERCVPFEDSSSNGLMAKQTLFDPLQVNSSNIFYINTALEPTAAAEDYANQIKSYFGKAPVQFDLVLLGLGDNAHTASLFPHTAVLYEMKQLVAAVFVQELNAYRITMTAPLINEARAIAFLVYGESKALAVQQVLKENRNVELYPAQLIEAEEGTVYWFLDDAAAALVK